MPWKVMDVVDERTRFVLEFDSGSFTMAELCRIYGIARKTGYIWVDRYEAGGLTGLHDRRYGACNHPNQTGSVMEEQIMQVKRAHPSWGAKKLRAHLLAKKKGVKWPVVSTFGEILRRAGLSTPQRKRLRVPLYTKPFEEVEKANQIWCADFKGWFRTGKGERIDPLTMTDAHSRYLLRCQSVEKTNTEQVQAIFAAAFREYGLPQRIRTDNGAPFASRAIAGISRLSIFWMKLGIAPERIKPGHPEQNGRHERMHRTLKAETAKPPAADRRAQQKASRIQRGTSARGAEAEDTGLLLPEFAAPLSGSNSRTGIRQQHEAQASLSGRNLLLERHTDLYQQVSERRVHRCGTDRRSLLGSPFRHVSPGAIR
jgi:transposase InsO family protein